MQGICGTTVYHHTTHVNERSLSGWLTGLASCKTTEKNRPMVDSEGAVISLYAHVTKKDIHLSEWRWITSKYSAVCKLHSQIHNTVFFPRSHFSESIISLILSIPRIPLDRKKRTVPRKAFSTFMFFPRKVIVLFVHSRLFCSIIFRCTASYISGRDMHNLWKGYHHLFFALSLTVSAPSLWICVCSDHLNVFLTIWPDFCTWDIFSLS